MHYSVGEINVICTDVERSLQFYRDVLGFEVVQQEGPCYHLKCGNATFLLLPFAEGPRTMHPYCALPEFSVDLMVDDLEEAYAHLGSHNVELAAERKADAKSFFIRDPDGLVFEIIQS